MPSPSTLRVATLNIWNRSGPWAERRALIREQLGRLSPDVLGLQEVLRQVPDGEAADGAWTVPAGPGGEAPDQASEVVRGSLEHVAYARAMDYGSGLAFGNAIASRYPILEHAAFELPGVETGERRVLLHALIEHPAGLLPVFVTHLNWKLHHGAVRVRQVQAIAEHVKQLAPIHPARLPPVLMGDFNAAPDADEIRYLTGLATLGGKSVFFTDAWVHAGDGPGYTFDRKNPFAAIAHEPPRRIDYVFVRGPDAQLRGEPLRTALAFAEPVVGEGGATVYPSDHFGVVTELTFTSRSWGT